MLTPSKSGFTVKWDEDGQRMFETGVERGVLYPKNSNGTYGSAVAWNGLTTVEESPSGAESNPVYADDQKYLDLRSIEEYGYTINAYMYPDEFAECDGSAFLDDAKALKIGQQKRKQFGFCYTTKIGNDVDQSDYGYKIHLCYNSTASPASRSHATENESPEATEMSWECSTIGVKTTFAGRNVSHMEIDMTKLTKPQRILLENTLFGDGTNAGRFLEPDEVYELLYTTPVTPSVKLSSNTLSLLWDETAGEGTSATLTATTVPAGTTVTWESEDSTKVTVNEGVVTAAGVTTAPVGVTASFTPEGSDTPVSATCAVTVTPSSEG